ncbi:MAG: hypothetical protein AAFP90_20210 [Planctomycetota bacterium]
MRTVFALMVAWMAATASSVDVPAINKEFRPIVVSHDAGVRIDVLHWAGDAPSMLPDDHFVRQETATIWTAPAGVYAVVGNSDGVVIVTVVRENSPRPPPPGPNPSPDPPRPEPKPDPSPGPPPLVAKWLMIIEEVSDRPKYPKQTAVSLDLAFWKTLTDRGFQVRRYDANQEAAKPYTREANAKLPALVIMESAEKWRVFRLPESTESVEQIIRENVVR